MKLSLFLGWIVVILPAILSIGLLYWLLSVKMKLAPKWGIIAGIGVGLIPFVLLLTSAGTLIVVSSGRSVTKYFVWGSASYTQANGQSFSTPVKALKAVIINDTDEDLVMEEIVYSTSVGDQAYEDFLIPAHSACESKISGIDYEFDEQPPSSISVDSKSGSTHRRHWLRPLLGYIAESGVIPPVIADRYSDYTATPLAGYDKSDWPAEGSLLDDTDGGDEEDGEVESDEAMEEDMSEENRLEIEHQGE